MNAQNLTPGVTVNIINNTTLTPPPLGTVYAGMFKSNRGPISRTYTSPSDLNSYCGPEDPSTSIGLCSIYDMLSQSQNVIGVRILHPYNATEMAGDSFAYVIYDNVQGWVVPTQIISIAPNHQTYSFGANQAFVIYSIGPGDYYNNCSILLTKDPVQKGYDLNVYDANNVLQESFYVTFDINVNGIDSQTFAEAVINGNSKYIGILVNYSYFINNDPTGILNPIYFVTQTPSNGVSSIISYQASSNTSFYGFSEATDSLGNIYISGGYIQSGTDKPVNTSVIQFNTNANTWLILPNTNLAFSPFEDIVYASVFSPDNGGIIYAVSKATVINPITTVQGLHICLFAYSLASYSWTNLGIIDLDNNGVALPMGLLTSSLAIIDQVIYLLADNTTTNVLTFFAITPSITYGTSGTLILKVEPIATLLSSQVNAKLITNSNLAYVTGGFSGVILDKNLYLANPVAGSAAGRLIQVAISPNTATGFVNATVALSDTTLHAFGGQFNSVNSDMYYQIDLSNYSINNQISTGTFYATVSTSFLPTTSYSFQAKGVVGSSGLITALGSVGTTSLAVTEITGAIDVLNSLQAQTNLYLGNSASAVTDADVIAAIALLEDTTNYPLISVLADCGFNDPAVSLAINNLMSTRQQGIGIISMPTAYERNSSGAVTYRQSLNINDGYTMLATPGEYVRINSFTGVFSLFPMSGAIAANMAANDANGGIQVSPAGPTNGLLSVIIKLPPVIQGTPLTVPYTEITYSLGDTNLFAANQVDWVGRYGPQFPGIYLKNDLLLTSEFSLLQEISIKRLVLSIATFAAQTAPQFLFLPNDPTTQLKAFTLYSNYLAQVQAKPGSLNSYQVICNSSNNTPQSIDEGILNISLILVPISLVKFIVINVIANSLENTVSISLSQ